MSQPAPTASGTLATTPLAHLLVYGLDRHLTGSLVLEEASRTKHAVYFVDGVPAAARAATPLALLGGLAVERGVLAAERLEAALALAREGNRRLGQVLVEWGALNERSLEGLLHEQVARRVVELAQLPSDTRYGYYDGVNFLERAGGAAAGGAPLALIWRTLKHAIDEVRLRDVLARLEGVALRFHPDAPLSGFGFDAAEQSVVDVLAAKPQPLSELAARQLVERQRLERLAYLFVALRYFDVGGTVRPVGVIVRASVVPRVVTPPGPQVAISPRPSPPPPPSDSPPAASVAPADDPFRQEIRARAESTRDSYYDLLGVARDAPTTAIAAAYFQLAKRWHPDRLGPQYSDVRELATKIFARMSEAHQILSDPARRREYDELEKTGEGAAEEQEQIQRVVRAAMSIQKAQILLKRNNLAGAEEAARAALDDAPDQADNIAMVAWLEALKPNADLESLLKDLDRAVKMEQANTRVRWFRGQILKRLGRNRRALEDFRMIVEQDPRHVDAQREIRLFEMGRQPGHAKPEAAPASGEAGRASQVPAEKGSLLGRFFKK